jgi:transcriptional regulator with XRE-family HTH domain
MSLQTIVDRVRADCLKVLSQRGLSQQDFADRYDISSSWLNKFLRAKKTDYRVGSVEHLRLAVQQEKRAS